MPVNILRLNHAASSHPNDRIAFVKPLSRPSSLEAEHIHAGTFLHAIAAQCLPIMKRNHLSVTTLEEYEPNREFIGRNFNNGEVIQLVLRRRDGSWMSFRQVQMVMMHELAHNVQMNHGKAFWTERNRLASEMKALWQKNYTGEGFWGSGRSLESLQDHAGNTVDVGEGRDVEGLCGGTFRSQGRKRKRRTQDSKGPALTWRQQKDKRILKKFGKNGIALGEDEDARIKLEISRKGPLGGRPRVAGSKRGRELRAAAALARFGVRKDQSEQGESQSESGTEDDEPGVHEAQPSSQKAAVDINGNRLLDSMGFGMVRTCGNEDVDNMNVKNEMDDFDLWANRESKPVTACTRSENESGQRSLYSIPHHRPLPPTSSPHTSPPSTPIVQNPATLNTRPAQLSLSTADPTTTRPPLSITCPICTTHNNPLLNPTCMTCAHVLDKRKDPRAWTCSSEACSNSKYVNAGDSGRCGGCGAPR